MNMKLVFALMAALILTGCASLPKPDEGSGAAYIPIDYYVSGGSLANAYKLKPVFINQSSGEEISPTFDGGNGVNSVVVKLPAGAYTFQSFDFYSDGSMSSHTNIRRGTVGSIPFEFSFSVMEGQMSVIPAIVNVRYDIIDLRSTSISWGAEYLTPEQQKETLAVVRAKDKDALWQVNLAQPM